MNKFQLLESISSLFEDWLGTNQVTTLIGVETFVVALLIPLALFLLGSESASIAQWEKVLLLREVVKPLHQLCAFLAISLSILAWGSNLEVNLFLLVLFFGGVSIQLISMKSAARWLNSLEVIHADNYRENARVRFIGKLGEAELLNFWFLVLSSEKEKTFLENRKLMQMLFGQLSDSSLKHQSRLEVLKCVLGNFEKIEMRDPVVQEIVFDFVFGALSADFEEAVSDGARFEFQRTSESFLDMAIVKSFEQNYLLVGLFRHIKTYLNQPVPKAPERIIQAMAHQLFETDNEDVWQLFPPEWLVTTQSITSQDIGVPHRIFDEYIRWITKNQSQLSGQNIEINLKADLITSRLFPAVDIFLLSHFIILQYSDFLSTPNESWDFARVRNFIESNHAIGNFGRTRMGVTDTTDLQKRHHQEKLEAKGLVSNTAYFPILRSQDSLRKLLLAAQHLSTSYVGHDLVRCQQLVEMLIFLQGPDVS